MPIEAGTMLGAYEITAAIGAGGMGEVYRARDTKLGREVAIKVLPEELSRDRERRDRFEREAKLLASLNHPAIATLYGFEDGFLVMELVEGETLAERISRGPIPLQEATPLFIQVAEGLEAAHDKGIIHRDLKPANIMICPDGKPKILDFGLAKAFVGDDGSATDASQSPTLTKGTALGTIMGTASYMSPEQARGKPVDKRTDVFAFGCCLYEALTARKAFDGETITDIIAAVVNQEPRWESVPSSVRNLLERCLRKDLEWRMHDIADARIDLKEAPGENAPSPRGLPWAYAFSLLAFGMLAAGLAVRSFTANLRESDAVMRFDISDPRVQVASNEHAVALSRDGTVLAYTTGDDEDETFITLRFLNQLETRTLPETSGARNPFFSPDGEWIGFFAGGQLKKVSVNGGSPTTVVAKATYAAGADWGDDDRIVFGTDSGLARVSSSGGPAETITVVADESVRGTRHSWPEVLPGAVAVLFTVHRGGRGESRIEAVEVETGARRTIVDEASDGRYSASGHLVFRRGSASSLFGVLFDPDRLVADGPALPVLEDILTAGGGAANFALSEDGTLVHLTSVAATPVRDLHWVDRDGESERILRGYRIGHARLSPDEERVALEIYDEQTGVNVWLYDFTRETLSRLTLEGQRNGRPIWTPNGEWIVFESYRGDNGVYRKRSDGSGTAEKLLTLADGGYTVPDTISPDGRILGLTHHLGDGNFGTFDLEERGSPTLVLVPYTDRIRPAISPDGRFVAYASDESGRHEIYVAPFPTLEGRWQVSTEGGHGPVWSRDGSELFYRDASRMMVVAIEGGESFLHGQPRLLFENSDIVPVDRMYRHYDVAADGRFLMLTHYGDEPTSEMHLVLNFDEELKHRAPAK